jgi:hypothetical protein
MSDQPKPQEDEIDHSQDEVIESDNPDQKDYKATTTIHRAETPEGDEATPPANYTQQEQNAPQPDMQQEVEPQAPEGDDEPEKSE